MRKRFSMEKKTPESLEALIFSRAGDVFSGNSDLENAASSYSSATEFSKSPYNLEKAAIAYYRLAKSLGSAPGAKGYAEKAETLFQRVAYVDPARVDSHYYLGMIYSERGDINKAATEFSVVYDKADELSDRAVMSLIESYIFIKEERYEKESEAYSMLEDPFLASFYEFVKKYAIETDLESRLKDRYRTDNPYSALAMEINGLHKRYFMDEAMRKRIPNPVSRFAVMISAMFGKEGSEEDAIAIFSKPESADLRKLPPYTRGVVTDFLSRFGLTPNSFKMPYMIQKDIHTIERLILLISDLRDETLDKHGIRRRLAELMDSLPANLRQSYLGFFESLEFKSFDEIYNGLSKLRLELLESIFKRLRAFYPKTETSRLFRMIVSSLKMKEDEKIRIIDRLEYID
jgi:tetratricopeptide (TPR) repeat protein